MGKFFGYLIGLVILGIVVAGGVVGYFVLEGDAPELEIISAPTVMGREYLLEIKARDERSGLRVVSAAIIQDEKIVDLDAKTIEGRDWWRGSGVEELTASWAVRPLTLGLSEGKALLRKCSGLIRTLSLPWFYLAHLSTTTVAVQATLRPL